MKIVGPVLILLGCLAGSVHSLWAQTSDRPSVPAAGDESLGRTLLDDLKSPPITAPSETDDQRVRPAPAPPRAYRVDQPTRFDDLGEDLGAPSGPLPLVRARQNMHEAGAILAQVGDVAAARSAQERVIAQLDELINGLCKQCQGGGKPGEKPSQANKPGQPKLGASRPGMSAIAPRSSSDTPPPAGERQLSPAEREALVKQLWGHLPEREREQLLQSFSGEFLPKYELELETYFQRLAAEKDGAEK